MKRRDFVRTACVSAAVIAAGPLLRLSGFRPSVRIGREGWSGESFQRVKGSTFNVSGPNGSQTLVLDQVDTGARTRIEWASLRFRGDAGDALAEGSHPFSHPSLGTMILFIVPGTVSGSDCFYRATLCRLV
jgi:hypothetical protein